MIIFDWLIRRSRLFTSTVESARTAKFKSQAKIERVELGWRKRYDETREQHLKLMGGLLRIRCDMDKFCGGVSFCTTIDERLLGCGNHSCDLDDGYMRYVAQEVAHLVEREIRALNAATLHQHIAYAKRRQEDLMRYRVPPWDPQAMVKG